MKVLNKQVVPNTDPAEPRHIFLLKLDAMLLISLLTESVIPQAELFLLHRVYWGLIFLVGFGWGREGSKGEGGCYCTFQGTFQQNCKII